MDTNFTALDDASLPGTPCSEVLSFTISPSQTTLHNMSEEPGTPAPEEEEKKPAKKRKSWGQELPVPKTNLPPRKRAKTEDEKEQRRIERVLRNRAAAQTSRERKRLEVEKLENEKQQMEQDRSLLMERLAQMEARVNRLENENRILKQQAHSSRGSSPLSETSSTSPTLAPTLFKQEEDQLNINKIPFPPSEPSLHLDPSNLNSLDIKPTLNLSGLLETGDLTQHPAAVLCDLQCQSPALPSPAGEAFQSLLMQLLYLTMISTAYSAVVLPLSQILRTLKEGSTLTCSAAAIQHHFPLIQWLISTPSLSASSSTGSTPRPVFRMRLLQRLLACSPALARPLCDATGRALQQVVTESRILADPRGVESDESARRASWTSLMTMAWAMESIARKQEVANARREDPAGELRRLCEMLGSERSSQKSKSTTTTRNESTSWVASGNGDFDLASGRYGGSELAQFLAGKMNN